MITKMWRKGYQSQGIVLQDINFIYIRISAAWRFILLNAFSVSTNKRPCVLSSSKISLMA